MWSWPPPSASGQFGKRRWKEFCSWLNRNIAQVFLTSSVIQLLTSSDRHQRSEKSCSSLACKRRWQQRGLKDSQTPFGIYSQVAIHVCRYSYVNYVSDRSSAGVVCRILPFMFVYTRSPQLRTSVLTNQCSRHVCNRRLFCSLVQQYLPETASVNEQRTHKKSELADVPTDCVTYMFNCTLPSYYCKFPFDTTDACVMVASWRDYRVQVGL